MADRDGGGEGRPRPAPAASSAMARVSSRAASREYAGSSEIRPGGGLGGQRRAARPRPSAALRPRSAAAATRPGSVSGRSAVSSVRVRSRAVPGSAVAVGGSGVDRGRPRRRGSAGAMVTWCSPSLGWGRAGGGGRSGQRHAAGRGARHPRGVHRPNPRGPDVIDVRTGRRGRAVGRSSDCTGVRVGSSRYTVAGQFRIRTGFPCGDSEHEHTSCAGPSSAPPHVVSSSDQGVTVPGTAPVRPGSERPALRWVHAAPRRARLARTSRPSTRTSAAADRRAGASTRSIPAAHPEEPGLRTRSRGERARAVSGQEPRRRRVDGPGPHARLVARSGGSTRADCRRRPRVVGSAGGSASDVRRVVRRRRSRPRPSGALSARRTKVRTTADHDVQHEGGQADVADLADARDLVAGAAEVRLRRAGDAVRLERAVDHADRPAGEQRPAVEPAGEQAADHGRERSAGSRCRPAAGS